METIFFITFDRVPKYRTGTYGHIVATIRPHKKETHRVRLTGGWNIIDYPGDASTPTEDHTTPKTPFNSVVSTPNSRFMCDNVEDFYLNTPIERYKYMMLPIDIIPQEIIDQYDLTDSSKMVTSTRRSKKVCVTLTKHVHCERATHRPSRQVGLQYYTPHARTLLTKNQSYHLLISPWLFWRQICHPKHEQHIVSALEDLYRISTDWDGKIYCGLTLKWDYIRRTVDLSIPVYVEGALHKFQHDSLTNTQHAPHKYI